MSLETIKSIAKFFANLMSNIFVVVLVGIVGVPALIAWATGTIDFLIQSITTPMPLWATIALIALCCLYTYLKLRQYQNSHKPPNIQEELIEEFGVYWNSQYKLRCKKCKWPLKCASKHFDPSIFFCSNCDTKHSLRDANGNHMTEAKAIEQLKKLLTSG